MNRIERALGMLRLDLVERAAPGDWDKAQAGQVTQAVAACLRPQRNAPGPNAHGRNPGLAREVVRRALHYINDNLHCKLKWEEIAAAVGMDPFKFGRGFKLATGMTPHQYVIWCRVSRATELLARGELSIAEIALEVGCSCQSHLTTLFRNRTGTTPGAFRRAARASRRLLDAAATWGHAFAPRHGEVTVPSQFPETGAATV